MEASYIAAYRPFRAMSSWWVPNSVISWFPQNNSVLFPTAACTWYRHSANITHPIFHHRDFVRTSCGGKPVGDEDDGFRPGPVGSARNLLDRVEKLLLRVGVKGRRLWTTVNRRHFGLAERVERTGSSNTRSSTSGRLARMNAREIAILCHCGYGKRSRCQSPWISTRCRDAGARVPRHQTDRAACARTSRRKRSPRRRCDTIRPHPASS